LEWCNTLLDAELPKVFAGLRRRANLVNKSQYFAEDILRIEIDIVVIIILLDKVWVWVGITVRVVIGFSTLGQDTLEQWLCRCSC
jgi:hypothetical protein